VTGWRAVLDAQVWISAAIQSRGVARAIITAARSDAFRIVTSPYIRSEVRDVLARPPVKSFLAPGFDAAEWVEVVELAAADVVEEAEGPPVVPADPKDDPYLWTAWVGAATHLVTWDEQVLAVKHFHGAQVVEPPEFLRRLRARHR